MISGPLWSIWWLWVIAGLALAILELFVSGHIFLGFALGALVTGALVAGGLLGESLALTLLSFALASALGWLGLRRLLGLRKGQVKHFERDINEE